MRLIKPISMLIGQIVDTRSVMQMLEAFGRTCYKSEERITDTSADAFVRMLITRGHETVLEHYSVPVRFIVDRGVSHELVRHRIASFSQESTRYVNYTKRGIEFVIPPWVDVAPGEYTNTSATSSSAPTVGWLVAMRAAENSYNNLIGMGWKPEQARSVLPNSLKTELVMTCNLRQWRWVLNQRCSDKAHPQMREVMLPLLAQFHSVLPAVFDDIHAKYLLPK